MTEVERLRATLMRVRRHVTPMVKGYIDNVLRSTGSDPAVADGEVGAARGQEEPKQKRGFVWPKGAPEDGR